MALLRDIQPERLYIGQLEHDADLLAELTAIANEASITLGRVEGIGAVKRAVVGYYDQGTQIYRQIELNRPMEIAALVGNISLRDGESVIHAHLTLTDEKGHAFGGHLCPGTIVFAGEVVVHAYAGTTLERDHDAVTGLPLWKM